MVRRNVRSGLDRRDCALTIEDLMGPSQSKRRSRLLARVDVSRAVLAVVLAALGSGGGPRARADERLDLTRLIALWADYDDAAYLDFVSETRPDIVQVGFYGAHFFGLVDTPFGGGYPAHLPVRGQRECADWLARLNREIHARGARVVGHMNVKFLIGDPESPDGPRGFFKFYRDGWDESLLGPRPGASALDFLEKDASGNPISAQSYAIGGMREYWAC